ncbi:hypothetical protein Fmac_023824 [Flemingia macrophylla]|uniref:Uncharacterized protein n=1 Tax=Flemingia macrophylla TaxID=520843 RepID=A0ABD1LMP5_9FABA
MLESEVEGASCVEGSLERETQVVPRPRVRPASRESREGNPSDVEADGASYVEGILERETQDLFAMVVSRYLGQPRKEGLTSTLTTMDARERLRG